MKPLPIEGALIGKGKEMLPKDEFLKKLNEVTNDYEVKEFFLALREIQEELFDELEARREAKKKSKTKSTPPILKNSFEASKKLSLNIKKFCSLEEYELASILTDSSDSNYSHEEDLEKLKSIQKKLDRYISNFKQVFEKPSGNRMGSIAMYSVLYFFLVKYKDDGIKMNFIQMILDDFRDKMGVIYDLRLESLKFIAVQYDDTDKTYWYSNLKVQLFYKLVHLPSKKRRINESDKKFRNDCEREILKGKLSYKDFRKRCNEYVFTQRVDL